MHMRQAAKILSLMLAAALCVGPLCLNAGAASGGATSSSFIPEDASQGSVRQEGDMVTLTRGDGTKITFTSAYLGGTLSFPEPDPYYNGRQVELKTIIAQPGCIGYAVTPSGETFTGAEDDQGLNSVFCYDFVVNSDGTFGVEGFHDMSVLGNTYYVFGTERETWGYSVVLVSFYADDGRYCIVTQEALDLFCQLTGIQVENSSQEQPAQGFQDVSPDAWYAGYVQTVQEKGLFSGKGNGLFAPEDNMTYAEFLAVLSQFSGETIPASAGAWYQGYVDWAGSKGLIPPEVQADFAPNASITRQDMAALMGAFLNAYSHSGETVNTGAASFTDQSSISAYAQDGIAQCYALGIMGGNPDGTFAPQATATRAQVAVTMVQMARVMGR